MPRIPLLDVLTLPRESSQESVASKLNSCVGSKTLLVVLLWILAIGFAAADLQAQSTSASGVVGRVTDATGAVVPGATVHITDIATGLARVVTTNGTGDFTAQNLPPDNYSIRVEKPGFQASSIASVPLEIGKTASVPVTLQVGTQTQTVEVTTAGPQLQTQDASVGQVISAKQENDLPLNGRNMLQLASLTAGVSAEQTSNTGNPAGAGGIGTRNLYITVDGGRASSTNYVLDGVNIRSFRFNTESVITSVDATQEFNVVRGPSSTEYGQGTATVTMLTKSGTNQIHGSAFIFTRSEIFDARDYFSTVANYPHKPVFHRNQYGGTLGMPFIKNRLFGFVGYERQDSVQSQPAYAHYPTLFDLQTAGLYPGVTPSTLSSTSQVGSDFQLYNVLFPTFVAQGTILPGGNVPTPSCGTEGTDVTNQGYTCTGKNNFLYSNNFVDDYTTWTGRMDETISSKQNMFERYIDYNSIQKTPNPQSTNISPVVGRNMAVGHTYVFSPSVLNDLRLGWNHTFMYGESVSPYVGTSWDQKSNVQNVTGDGLPTEMGRPSIGITGFSSLGGDSGLGQGDAENVYSIGDTIALTKGKHSIRAGIQYSWRQSYGQAELASNGTTSFNSLQNLGKGFCSTCRGSNGNSKGHWTDNTYGVFANDIWQMTPKLTLNYGVRWEYDSPFVEKDHLEAGWDAKDAQIAFHVVPPPCTATLVVDCIPASLANLGIFNLTPNFFPAGIVQPTKNRFAPRVGLAYQATPNLVIRAGFGMYVENVNTNELQFVRNITPIYITQSFNNYQIVSTPTDSNLFPSINDYNPTSDQGFPAPFTTDPNNKLPYTYQQDFSIQQNLGHQTVLELAYTGSDSHLLWRRYDQNEDLFTGPLTPAYEVRPYHTYSHGMLTSANVGHANFQGVSVRIEQRPIHGFYYLGVYQFSKNEDDESGEADANDTSFSNNLEFDRAPSNFDQRQRMSISGGYTLPFGEGQKYLTTGIGSAILGGWTIQPIVGYHSGFPFSIGNGGATFGQYAAFRAILVPGRTIASAKLNHPTAAEWYDATAFCSTQTLYGVAPQCLKASYDVAPASAPKSARGLPGNNAWQGNVRRNSLPGPSTFTDDFSVIKNFKIYERFTGQFRAEAFNILNHPNFARPASTETSSSAGQITSTSTDNRDLQFALKFLW